MLELSAPENLRVHLSRFVNLVLVAIILISSYRLKFFCCSKILSVKLECNWYHIRGGLALVAVVPIIFYQYRGYARITLAVV